jgi:hypothetical protein
MRRMSYNIYKKTYLNFYLKEIKTKKNYNGKQTKPNYRRFY